MSRRVFDWDELCEEEQTEVQRAAMRPHSQDEEKGCDEDYHWLPEGLHPDGMPDGAVSNVTLPCCGRKLVVGAFTFVPYFFAKRDAFLYRIEQEFCVGHANPFHPPKPLSNNDFEAALVASRDVGATRIGAGGRFDIDKMIYG